MRRTILTTLAVILALMLKGAAALAATSTVDCGAGQSLAAAVAAANPGDTLDFTGTCAGPVTVAVDNLTLDGGSVGIVDGGGASNALIVGGVHATTLQNMTVRNGISGVVIQAGGVATVTNLTVSGNAFDGILITGNSSATISNSSLTGTPVNGVDVESTSSVIFTGTDSSSGAIAFGINIGTGSSMTMTGANVTVSNNGLGIQIGIGASGFIDPASTLTALNNTTTGVTVVSGSHLVVFGGKIDTSGNKINGFSADSKSGVDLDAASTLTSHDNLQDGVHLEETSVLNMFNTTKFSGVPGPTRLITHNNRMAGVRVLGNSEFHMHNQVALLCQNNLLGGMVIDNGSATTVIKAQITGNIGNDVDLTFGSRGDLSLSTIGKISCDATSLIRGDTGVTCPAFPPSGSAESSSVPR
jgi:hypothetical protein